jgi:hypothetical protein
MLDLNTLFCADIHDHLVALLLGGGQPLPQASFGQIVLDFIELKSI